MNKISIDRSYRENGPLPLYKQYDGQLQPQSTFLELESDGSVMVGYSGEVGSAIPMRVYEGKSIRWSLYPFLTVKGIDALLDKLEPLLQEYHEARISKTYLKDYQYEIEGTIQNFLNVDNPEYIGNVVDAYEYCCPAMETVLEEFIASGMDDNYVYKLADETYDNDGVILTNVDRLEWYLQDRVEEIKEFSEEEFYDALVEKLEKLTPTALLGIKGIYEILSEEFHNEIMDDIGSERLKEFMERKAR